MRERSALEVLLVFLRLGLTSFGGPVAHIGYFREELVVRRRWVDEGTYGDLVALCQFLPGPASSQVGFTLGLLRAGYPGAALAWMGFTLPSAILLTAFAFGAGWFGNPVGAGLLHGLELVAVAIVAQAVWGMSRVFCTDRTRAGIAVAAAFATWYGASPVAQLGTILLGGMAGFWLCRAAAVAAAGTLRIGVSRRMAVGALAVFLACLIVPSALHGPWRGIELFQAFYRSGALVFGGGHVVLPLLNEAFVTPGWVDGNTFLAGYGAAQAVPGPLFTFAAYLGAAVMLPAHGVAGAILGLVAIFLPGMLILVGTLPFWDAFRRRPGAQATMRGINAAVVGLLGAALYDPLWVGAVRSALDLSVVLGGIVLLLACRAPPLLVVVLGALAGAAGA